LKQGVKTEKLKDGEEQTENIFMSDGSNSGDNMITSRTFQDSNSNDSTNFEVLNGRGLNFRSYFRQPEMDVDKEMCSVCSKRPRGNYIIENV
jgi:hypothetical protein